jgi:tagaturonate reductase
VTSSAPPLLAADLPTLGRELLQSGLFRAPLDLSLPDPRLLELPEKIVQFGTGAFLRGFVEYFIDEANRAGRFGGRIVAVGSTESGRDLTLARQDGLFTLLTQGVDQGTAQHEYRIITSLSRALSASRQWDDVLALARSPYVELVFSNTTEAGITLDADDSSHANPPRSFPGKLTRFLYERARAFDYADDHGLVVLPCELIEQNGERLRELVLTLARRWALGDAFISWIECAVRFCNTLVDRIVAGTPDRATLEQCWAELGYRDELLTCCESYRLFAIQDDGALSSRLGFTGCDEGVILTPDITPYRERKVQLLNGAHSILSSVAILAGCDTVRDAVTDTQLGPFLRGVLFDELVPSVDAPDADAFAEQVLDRFANPFLRHAVADITLQLTMKLRIRIVPTVVRYAVRTGCAPKRIALGFAAYLLLLRPDVRERVARRGVRLAADGLAERAACYWTGAQTSVATLASRAELVRAVCADRELWHADLSKVPGFVDAVSKDLVQIEQDGVRAVLAGSASALVDAAL